MHIHVRTSLFCDCVKTGSIISFLDVYDFEFKSFDMYMVYTAHLAFGILVSFFKYIYIFCLVAFLFLWYHTRFQVFFSLWCCNENLGILFSDKPRVPMKSFWLIHNMNYFVSQNLQKVNASTKKSRKKILNHRSAKMEPLISEMH